MTNEEVVEIFKKAGAVKEGHFLLTSGKHSGSYWEKFLVLQYPQYTGPLCQAIAEHYRDASVDVVTGPTTGGVILSYEVARYLGTRGIFAERVETPKAATGGRTLINQGSTRDQGSKGGQGSGNAPGPSGRAFRRGFTIAKGERVLVVDDILTTGSSLRDVLAEVRRLGGEVVGVAVLIDRSNGKVDFGVPLFSLHQLFIPTYEPDECPLCTAGVPLNKPGSSEP